MTDAVLALHGIERTYLQGTLPLEIFKGVDLSLRSKELVALVGPSGAGKSSLLHIAGLLEQPDAGEVIIGGRVASTLSDMDRTAIRRSEIGFVYQFHHLLPEFSALENVALPRMIAGHSTNDAKSHAQILLEKLGLGERLGHRPTALSGGEQQRVAIARALANKPRILLADEPTGNLDSDTAQMVFDELIAIVRSQDVAVLIATHNYALTRQMDRVFLLDHGHIEEVSEGELRPAPQITHSI